MLFANCGNNACIVTIIGKQLCKSGNIDAAVVVDTADINKVAYRVIEGVRAIWIRGRCGEGGHGGGDR